MGYFLGSLGTREPNRENRTERTGVIRFPRIRNRTGTEFLGSDSFGSDSRFVRFGSFSPGLLGLPDLRTFGMALRQLKLVRTDPDKTWATFRFPVDRAAQAFFDALVLVEVGDGSGPCFGRTTGSLVVPSSF
jgi:hypothetical protein